MGFYIFMFVMSLVIPAVMIIIGAFFLKRPPKKINGIYGYRTALSRKSQETWDFAHHYSGRLYLIIGLIMVIPSVIVMLLACGRDMDTVGWIVGGVELVQCVFLILPIIFTELALRRNFDENGRKC